MPGPRPVRIGTSEREAAVRELAEHYAEGRLDAAEYEERTAAAYAARTADDLTPLFADLPHHNEGPTVALPPRAASPVHMPSYDVPSYDVPSYDVAAPYGREPETGMPYSQRYKVIAGVLQLVLPFGVGRFYTGHVGTGLAQLLLTPIGIGAIWAFIDGILMLVGRPVDKAGRPLRP
jgi:TM2 domain-containing membrane protein YozV